MNCKIYTTRGERMTDQIIGFLAFPLVNILLWIIVRVISQTVNSPPLIILASVLPWLVNAIVIILAFLLRPQFGVGYMAFIAVALTVVAILSISFVAACFVTFTVVLSFPAIGDEGAISLFIFLIAAGIAVGLLGLGLAAIYIFWRWRSSH